MRTCASSRGKGKSFYIKRELHIFLLISGGHICVPKLYPRMATTYLEGDFKIYNTEDDGCTVETCLENEIKLLCLCRVFMWLSILLLLSRPTCKVLMMREMFCQITQKL